MRAGAGPASASAISVSVSGRGSRTAPVTTKSRPQKARRPMICATGRARARSPSIRS